MTLREFVREQVQAIFAALQAGMRPPSASTTPPRCASACAAPSPKSAQAASPTMLWCWSSSSKTPASDLPC
jgi:hypothetical protein